MCIVVNVWMQKWKEKKSWSEERDMRRSIKETASSGMGKKGRIYVCIVGCGVFVGETRE